MRGSREGVQKILSPGRIRARPRHWDVLYCIAGHFGVDAHVHVWRYRSVGPRLRFSVGLHSLNHPRSMELWKVPGSKEPAGECTSASKLLDTGRRASAAPPGHCGWCTSVYVSLGAD